MKKYCIKMVKAGIIFSAAVLFWSGCVSAETPASAAKPVKAGVYAGRGISGNGAVEWFRIVQSSPELEIKVLDSEMIRNGGLDGLDLLVMPGGSSPAIKRDLGTNGTARIKDFIRNGGGYVGTCAGCCLMMEEAPDPSRGIGVMPFYRSGSKGRYLIPIELNGKGAKALGINKGTYIVQYSHGPILEPSTQLVENASFEVWGTFRTDAGKYGNQPEMYGRAAVVGGTYGKGRVFVISCHPEFFENSRLIVEGAFRYVTGRNITLPVRPRRRRALTVAAYAVYPIGVETAKTLLTTRTSEGDSSTTATCFCSRTRTRGSSPRDRRRSSTASSRAADSSSVGAAARRACRRKGNAAPRRKRLFPPCVNTLRVKLRKTDNGRA